MSPLGIMLLMHIHAICEPIANRDSSAVQELIVDWVRGGVIRADNDSASGFRTTPLGDAWVKVICRVPLPKPVFVDANGLMIE